MADRVDELAKILGIFDKLKENSFEIARKERVRKEVERQKNIPANKNHGVFPKEG